MSPKSKVNPTLFRGGAIEVIETYRTGSEERRDRTGNALGAALDTHPDYLLCWSKGDHDYITGDHGVTRSHTIRLCSSTSLERSMVEPLLPGTLIQGEVSDDTILELHQAYSSAFCGSKLRRKCLSTHLEREHFDVTTGMTESVLPPCGKASAKVHRPTQQRLISLTPSMEMITPTHDENAGTDLESNTWDNSSHCQEASSSRCSMLQDGSLSNEVSESGCKSIQSYGLTHGCRTTYGHTPGIAYPRIGISQGTLPGAQRQVIDLLLCT